MSERYSKLYSLPANLYASGSPIIIAAGALLKNNQAGKVLTQLKLRSISNNPIRAVTVSIQPKDTIGKVLGDSVSYQYLDLNIDRDEEFGQKTPIPLPNETTRAFNVVVTNVVFCDNSIWNGTTDTWDALPRATSLHQPTNDLELIKQYKLVYGAHSDFIYTEAKDLWYCDCGSINRNDESCCHSCGTESAAIKSVDWEILNTQKDARLIAEKEAKEEQERQKQIVAKERIKKTKKLALILTSTIVSLIVAVFCIKTFLIPSLHYNSAVKHLENREYGAAAERFYAAGDYKDAPEQLKDFLIVPTTIGSISSKRASETTYSYDEQGRKINESYRSQSNDGSSYSSKESYTYNSDDLLIKEVSSSRYGDAVTEYDYDKNGNIIRQTTIDEWNNMAVLSYCYDSNGNLTSEEISERDLDRNEPSEITDKYEYFYNSKGIEVKYIHTDFEEDEVFVYEYEYEFDENGRVIKEKRPYATNKGYWIVDYTYDTSGNLIKEVETDSDGDKTTTEYEYNRNGNLTKRVVTEIWDGRLFETATTNFTYNSHGNLIKEERVTTDSSGDVDYNWCDTYTINYQYGKYGELLQEVWHDDEFGTETTVYETYLVFYRPGQNNDPAEIINQ